MAGSGLSTVWSGLGAAGARRGDAPTTGSSTFQLSWIKNVEFAGSYIADTKGYYKKQGFSKVDAALRRPDGAAGRGRRSRARRSSCISAPDITSSAINNGADLMIVGAQYQKNPFCVMSLAEEPDQDARRT